MDTHILKELRTRLVKVVAAVPPLTVAGRPCAMRTRPTTQRSESRPRPCISPGTFSCLVSRRGRGPAGRPRAEDLVDQEDIGEERP